jgi:hypothetical protein
VPVVHAIEKARSRVLAQRNTAKKKIPSADNAPTANAPLPEPPKG